jgi:DNA-binding transcriptional LysR family regulator
MAAMNLLEALRYLAALDQHCHFGRAAQACHITQPALSNALRALESELGVALVRRSRQYEGLTTEGEVVLAHAHRLLHGSESMRQELASLAGAPRGQLKIGVVPSAVPVATRFAARLHALHPGVRVVLRSMSSQEIEAGLDSLAIDLGLGFTERAEVAQHKLRAVPQYREHHFLLCHTGGRQRLRFGAPMPWREAALRSLVLLTPEMHNRAVVDQALRAAGAEGEPVIETNSVLSLVVAVQAGAGLAAVLPGALVGTAREQPGLQAHPLVAPEVHTAVGWLCSGTAPASRAVVAALDCAQAPDWQAELDRHSGALAAG